MLSPALRLLLILLIAGIAGSFLLFGYHVYPVPSGDSPAFLPAALSLDAGRGLRAPVSDLIRHLDPTGQARFVQYPPLFPVSVALLMPAPSPRNAFLGLALLGALNLALAAHLFWRAAGSPRRVSPAMLAVAAATVGIATLLLGQQNGRPEPLATLWVLLSAHALLAVEPPAAWLPCGLLLGLTGATQPMAGVILGLLLATFLSVRLPARAAVLAAGRLLLLSGLVFLAVLALGPHGIGETLEGMQRHADVTLVGRDSQKRLATYWITHPGATFYALPFLLLLASLLRGLRTWREMGSPGLTGLCLALLAVVLWNSTGRSPEHAYNVLLFSPLAFAANLRWAFGREGGGARALVPTVHGLTGLGYLRALLLFGLFLTDGVSLDEARAQFARIAPTARGPVSVTSSLWVLTEDYDHLRAVPAGTPSDRLEGDLLILQQNYSGLSVPPRLAGLRLVENHFVDRSCRLLGLPVARTVPGYAFAVYRREP